MNEFKWKDSEKKIANRAFGKARTAELDEVVQSFKALPATDQHEVLVQLLREPIEASYEVPSDDELIATADSVFLEYDRAEKAS